MVAPAGGWEDHAGAPALLDPAELTRRLDDGWRASNAWPGTPITVDYVRFGAEQAWVSYREEDAADGAPPVGYASCLRGSAVPRTASGGTLLAVGSSWVAVHRWPDDAGLPALRSALTGGGLTEALGGVGQPITVEVVHYKPERRAVLRARAGDRTAYVRIREGGAAADREVPLLEHLHRWLGADPGIKLPRVLGTPWGSGGVVLSAVGGVSLTSLFETPAARGSCRSVGRTLARLHAVPPPDLLPALPSDARATMVHTAVEDLGLLERVAPALAQSVDGLRRRLLASAVVPPAAGVLLHGGMHPGNVLVLGDVVGIIDLDGAAVGEREADLGKLLAGIVIHQRGDAWDLAGEVLAAYEQETGQPVGHDVLGAWMTGVLVTRAMRDLRRGDQLRERRADRLLLAAVRCLAGGWPTGSGADGAGIPVG